MIRCKIYYKLMGYPLNFIFVKILNADSIDLALNIMKLAHKNKKYRIVDIKTGDLNEK